MKGLHFSVYDFSRSDVDLLIGALTLVNQYGLHCIIQLRTRGARIYLDKASFNILGIMSAPPSPASAERRSIVLLYILHSIKYKLGIK
jgi:hypothetical protein